MHPNPEFRKVQRKGNVDFARRRGFGTLAVNGGSGPLLSHIPFLLNAGGTLADLHLVRSNPIARLGEVNAVISVTGGDAYVSPDWYEMPDQVPTWNYVAVHLRGRLLPRPTEGMRAMLDRQSAGYEHRLAKVPWTTKKMTPVVLDRMLRQILPFQLEIHEVSGTWKLGQNKTDAARHAAAERIQQSHIGQELSWLADLMRDPPAA